MSVPVLSEQITLTDPSVSTVLRDLQRILFLRMMFAVMVSEAVNAMGSPSGMNAIATETQSTINNGTLIQSGYDLRRYAALVGLVTASLASWKHTNVPDDNDNKYHGEHD